MSEAAAFYAQTLDNPMRRHEPDGVCAPELPNSGIALPNATILAVSEPEQKNNGIHESGSQRHEAGMILPSDPQERKNLPICTGVLDYFPLALAEVAKVSKAGGEQHHPGTPLHWDKSKSMDHADCIARHLIDRGRRDSDGQRHSAKLVWRALANLEIELENERSAGVK
jgi:hypothetical protein